MRVVLWICKEKSRLPPPLGYGYPIYLFYYFLMQERALPIISASVLNIGLTLRLMGRFLCLQFSINSITVYVLIQWHAYHFQKIFNSFVHAETTFCQARIRSESRQKWGKGFNSKIPDFQLKDLTQKVTTIVHSRSFIKIFDPSMFFPCLEELKPSLDLLIMIHVFFSFLFIKDLMT